MRSSLGFFVVLFSTRMNTQASQQPRSSPHRLADVRASALAKCLMGCLLLMAGVGLGRPELRAKETYPAMAPLEQYLMPKDAEITLARSAGPESVTRDAQVLVLTPEGFKEAVPGHNGFVCVVQRSWSSGMDDPEFWNPKERSPNCFNAAAAGYCVALTLRKTELVLAGKSKAEISADLKAALAAGQFPALGAGAMCFMMSKEGYLNDTGKHWHPHLMFFVPAEPAARWGANLPGSPVLASIDPLDEVTVFMVPVGHWSDGTPDAHAH